MNTPKLPPLPEPSWPFGSKYNEKDMQAYAIAAIEAQGVPDEQRTRNLLARYENQWHRMGELWERCQGKGWSEAESKEFARLRDELTPATRALLLASAPPAPQAAMVQRDEMEAFLVVDLSRELGVKPLILLKALQADGFTGYSLNAQLTKEAVNAMRRQFKAHPAHQAKPQPLSDKEADRMTERFYLNGRPVPAPYRLSLVRATERHYGIKE